MMASQYDYTKYESYSQDPEFQRLQAQFAGAFGGGSFPTFSYEAFLNDPAYAQRIYGQISGPRGSDQRAAAARTAALSEIQDYFKRKLSGSTLDQTGGLIDPEPIFGPLKEQIKSLTEQQIRLGRGEISQGAGRAQQIAEESLAGTGLGRSGVAAGTFANIATERERKMEKLGQESRLRESESLLAVDRHIADLTWQERMREAGMNEQDIRDAAAFQRQLMGMQYQTMLQMAAEDEGGFWDSWGGVFQAVAGVGGIVWGAATGNPALIAAGGSALGGSA